MNFKRPFFGAFSGFAGKSVFTLKKMWNSWIMWCVAFESLHWGEE